ncbi:Scramblase [Trinorchestia longiramus]|nr:Scramblase [Trinorchestia longiramus]
MRFTLTGQYPPIQQQPGAPQYQQGGPSWMPIPMTQMSNYNPALAFLSSVDQLFVKQKKEMIEIFLGYESANKYEVMNNLGQIIFMAMEESDCCSRNMCANLRPLDIKIIDGNKTEVMSFSRPLACTGCCYPCCLQTMDIECPPGTAIGRLEQEWSILTPKFAVKDETGRTVLKIEGPICQCSLCGDVEFEVLSSEGNTQVGKISKKWGGILKESFTDADYFGVNFPMDLDAKVKASLLGALFLIDFLYFEHGNS